MPIALEIAATLIFAAHLLAVNLAMAGPMLCVWLEWRNRRATPQAAGKQGAGTTTSEARTSASSPSIERALAVWSLVALPVGMTFGAGLLGLLWLTGEKPYFAALAMIPSDRLAFGVGELVFYLIVMFAYQALCGASQRRRWLERLLAVAAASNLMLHFPPLFAMMAVLSHRPEMWSRSLDRGLYHSLLVDPEVVSRVVHVWLAAAATAGIFVMWLAARRSPARAPQGGAADEPATQEGAADEPAAPNDPGQTPVGNDAVPGDAVVGDAVVGDAVVGDAVVGDAVLGDALVDGALGDVPGDGILVGAARWALAASLAQLPVGLWALVALPAGGQAAWSGDFAALALLGAGAAASLALLQLLAGAAMGDPSSRIAERSGAMLVLTVLLMCGASRHLRQTAQPPAGGDVAPRAAAKIDPLLAPRAGGDAL